MPKKGVNSLSKTQVQVVVEAMKGKSPTALAEDRGRDHSVVARSIQAPEARGWWNAREQRKHAELEEILLELQDMVRKKPESAYRWADKISAIKLKAELDGHLQTHSEEKHLHIHNGDVQLLSEQELRKQLAILESSKKDDGVPQSEAGLV